MAKDEPKPLELPFEEVYPLLCPKCQLVLKKLLGEKLAERVIKE